MRSSKKKAIEKFICQKGIVRVSQITERFDLGRRAVFSYLKALGALTSFNSKGQFYILPQNHTFGENNLLFLGDVGFCQGGNLLATICHLVEISPQGLGGRELDQLLKTDTHTQLPALFRSGRLQRERALNCRGNAYIYFSSDSTRGDAQREAYFAPEEPVAEHLEDKIIPEDLPDVVEVLLTLLAHPDFSAKSVSLSLQRRGRKVSGTFANRVFQAYGLSKKKAF